jgi:hypothetical protein
VSRHQVLDIWSCISCSALSFRVFQSGSCVFLACVGVVWDLSIVHEDTPGLNLELMTLRFGNGVFYSGRGVASLVLDDCLYQVFIY